MVRDVGKSQDLCKKKKVNLHAEKSLSFRWLKVLDDVKLWELAKKKIKEKAKWGGATKSCQGCCQSRLRFLLLMVLFRISVFFELCLGF